MAPSNELPQVADVMVLCSLQAVYVCAKPGKKDKAKLRDSTRISGIQIELGVPTRIDPGTQLPLTQSGRRFGQEAELHRPTLGILNDQDMAMQGRPLHDRATRI